MRCCVCLYIVHVLIRGDCVHYIGIISAAMSAVSLEAALRSKEVGNEHYKNKQYEEAVKCYTDALVACPPEAKDERLVFLKNRAACNIKLNQHSDALSDTTASLQISPSDVKALFRHAQTLEAIQRLPEAFKTIKTLLQVDPGNKEGLVAARRLTAKIKGQAEAMQSTDYVVNEMYSALEDTGSSNEKKIKASKNLAILSRENAGAEQIYQSGGVSKIASLLNSDLSELVHHLLQALVGLCTGNESRCRGVVGGVSLGKLEALVGRQEKEISASAVAVLKQVILSSTDNESTLKLDVVKSVLGLLRHKDLSASGRDHTLELVISTAAHVGTGAIFLKEGAVSTLLWLAASSANLQCELNLSEDLRMNVSVTLSKLHESFGRNTPLRDAMKQQCIDFVHSRLSKEDPRSKVEGLTALATLLQGVLEVGNEVFGEESVLTKMVEMASLEDTNCQTIAAEALALAASDKERCHGIMKEGLPVLKSLYSSPDEGVRVRALVGLCKLGSVGGSNVNARTLAEGSTVKLEKACRKFLVRSKRGDNLKKWATEGLAFLSLDAEVKEALIGDKEAVQSLLSIPQTVDQSLLYGIATIFVNITNSYDKREKNQELEELGKFAGENLPKEHEFDGEEFVKKRVATLLEYGVVPALNSLSAVDSMAVHEQVARVFLALTGNPAHRGALIQQGGAKNLVPLATSNTPKGKLVAAQALAKIGITNDPRLAFPGQRSLEVVRPLVGLLKSDQGLQQFEGLLALTNLAGLNDDIRRRIFKEGGVTHVESLMFEEHELLRRAATEAMCNLVLLDEVHERFLSDDVERVKLLTLFAGEEDPDLAKAASGALAQLSHDPRICSKIMAVKSAKDIMKELVVSDNPELQHRGMYILANLVEASKEIAQQLVEDDFLEIFMALAQNEKASENVKLSAVSALQKSQDYGLIKPNPELKK